MKLAVAAVVLLFAATSAVAQTGGVKATPMNATPKAGDAAQVYKSTGVVKSVDAKKGVVTLTHEPIPSLNWPTMTMKFKVRDGTGLEGLAPGRKVAFEFVQQGNDHVITSLK